jgi:predicted ATPase/class 3 adenylate cyclase
MPLAAPASRRDIEAVASDNSSRTWALLLTDLVDSTQLAERLGDAAAAELGAAHDRLARDLLRHWRGREIDKTDGMLMLFEHAADAAGYALAYHAALAAMPMALKARAGLHVGAVILRRNLAEDVAHGAKPLEVEGIAKPVTARVMSLALGGQTLLTAEARAALGDTALRVQSHGHWRIKGIAEPVELFEVGDERAPFVPPPDSAKLYRVRQVDGQWLPVREVRHSLPPERDAFVGRQRALVELARRFDGGARLVSLLGIGGTGKTRLALRFARLWLGDFPGGAWFCDLSQARDVDGLVHAVAQGLDVPLGADDPLQHLGHAIAGRGCCLIILDNFEQVARHAGQTLGLWLDRAVEARFLVTSREVLGVAGEEAIAVAPLDPADAKALYLQRAASARADFHADAADQAAIEQLVGVLDGLPLAIELAAARVRVMSPGLLLARMGERFKLLAAVGGRQDRQTTLRATFDWSWDLLSDAEKAALAQLSVFEGGFTMESAEAVLDLSGCAERPWVVDVVHSLVDKSFVRPSRSDRFDLLVSVQLYAAERLAAQDGPDGSCEAPGRRAVLRHCRWFAGLGPQRAVEGACADLSNLVIACKRAVAAAEPGLAVGALQGAWAALSRHGPFSAGIELARLVSAQQLDDADAARVHAVLGKALESRGLPVEAREHYGIALQRARRCSDRACQVDMLVQVAHLNGSESRFDEAREALSEALAKARELGNADLEVAALNELANLEADQGQLEPARLHYESGLERAASIEDKGWQSALLGNLGMLHANVGRIDAAQSCLERSLALARHLGDRRREGTQLCNLGMLLLVQRRPEASIDVSAQALQIARELGYRRVEGIVQCNLGLAHEELGHSAQALAHLDAAIGLMRELGDRRYEGQFMGYLGRVRARLREFYHARQCFESGLELLEQAADPVSLGILLCDRSVCEWHAGDLKAAERALERAGLLSGAAGTGPDSELGQAIERAAALVLGRS